MSREFSIPGSLRHVVFIDRSVKAIAPTRTPFLAWEGPMNSLTVVIVRNRAGHRQVTRPQPTRQHRIKVDLDSLRQVLSSSEARLH